jgi:hypothetical protein
MGIARTLKDVKRNFHWDGMNKEISNYCKTCVSCQRNKASNVKPYGLLEPYRFLGMPWQTITMDFIIGLPRTMEGYDGIVVFVDKLDQIGAFGPGIHAGSHLELHWRPYSSEKSLGIMVSPSISLVIGIPGWSVFPGRRSWELGSYCKFSTAFHPRQKTNKRFNRSLGRSD